MVILQKRNNTPGAIPTADEILVGEIAVNTVDGKSYTKTTTGEIVELSTVSTADTGDIIETDFSPTMISGLGLWIDPSDQSSLTMVGSVVATSLDKSGNERHFTQSSPSNRPSLALLNGRYAFDTSNGLCQLVGNAAARTITKNVSGITVAAVTQFGASTQQTVFFTSIATGTNARAVLSRNDTRGGVTLGGRRLDADSFQDIAYAVPTNRPVVLLGSLDYQNSDAFIRENGIQKNSTTTFQTEGNTSDTASLYVTLLAAASITVNHHNGLVGEICVWPRVLTPTELSLVERYLAKKWGIEI